MSGVGQLQFTRVGDKNFSVVVSWGNVRLRLGANIIQDFGPGAHPAITSDSIFINVSYVISSNDLEVRRFKHADITVSTTSISEHHTVKMKLRVNITEPSPVYQVGNKFYAIICTGPSVDIAEYQFDSYTSTSAIDGPDTIITYIPGNNPPIPPPQSELSFVIDIAGQQARPYSLVPNTSDKIRIEGVNITGISAIRFSRNVRYVSTSIVGKVMSSVFGTTIYLAAVQGTRLLVASYNTSANIVSSTGRVLHGKLGTVNVTHTTASPEAFFVVIDGRYLYKFNQFMRQQPIVGTGLEEDLVDVRGIHMFDTTLISFGMLGENITTRKVTSTVELTSTTVTLASPIYIYSEYPWDTVVGVNSTGLMEERVIATTFASRVIHPSPEHITSNDVRVRVSVRELFIDTVKVIDIDVVAVGLTLDDGKYYLMLAQSRQNFIKYSEVFIRRLGSTFALEQGYEVKFIIPDVSMESFYPKFEFTTGIGWLMYVNSGGFVSFSSFNLRPGTVSSTRVFRDMVQNPVYEFKPELTSYSKTLSGVAVVGVSRADNTIINHGVIPLSLSGRTSFVVPFSGDSETSPQTRPYISASQTADDYFYFANRFPRYVIMVVMDVTLVKKIEKGVFQIPSEAVSGNIRLQDYSILFHVGKKTTTVSPTGLINDYERINPQLSANELLLVSPDLSGRYRLLKATTVEFGEVPSDYVPIVDEFNETVHANQAGVVIAPIYRSVSQTVIDIAFQVVNAALTESFVIGLNLDYAPGDLVRLSSSSNSRIFLKVDVTNYDRLTGVFDGIVREISGTGVISSWNVNLDVESPRNLQGATAGNVEGRVVSLFGFPTEKFATLMNIPTDFGRPYHVNDDLDTLFTSTQMGTDFGVASTLPIYISDIPDPYFEYLSNTYSTKSFVRASRWDVYRYQRDGGGNLFVDYPGHPFVVGETIQLVILSGFGATGSYAVSSSFANYFTVVGATSPLTSGFLAVNVNIITRFDLVIDGQPVKDPRGVPAGHSIPSGYFSTPDLVTLVEDIIVKENLEGSQRYDAVLTYESPYIRILEDALREQRDISLSDLPFSLDTVNPPGEWIPVWKPDVGPGFKIENADNLGSLQSTRFLLTSPFPGRFERFEGRVTDTVGYIYYPFSSPVSGIPALHSGMEISKVVVEGDIIATIETQEFKAPAAGVITNLFSGSGIAEGGLLYELKIPVVIPLAVTSSLKSVTVVNVPVESVLAEGTVLADVSYIRQDLTSDHEAFIQTLNTNSVDTRVEFFNSKTTLAGNVNYEAAIVVGASITSGTKIATITYDQPLEPGEVTWSKNTGDILKEYEKVLEIVNNGVTKIIRTPVSGTLVRGGGINNLFQVERETISATHSGIISSFLNPDARIISASGLQTICTTKLTVPVIVTVSWTGVGELLLNPGIQVGSRIIDGVSFAQVRFSPKSFTILSPLNGIIDNVVIAAPRVIENLTYSRTGTVLAVTLPGHGLQTGDRVQIKNPATVTFNTNGASFITVVNLNLFTVTVTDDGGAGGQNLSIVVNPNTPLNPDTRSLITIRSATLPIQTPFVKVPGLTRPTISVTNTNVFLSYVRQIRGIARYSELVVEKRTNGNVVIWQNVLRLPEIAGDYLAHGFGLRFDLMFFSTVRQTGSVELRIYSDFERGRQQGAVLSKAVYISTDSGWLDKLKSFKVLVRGGLTDRFVYVFGDRFIRRITFNPASNPNSIEADTEAILPAGSTNLIGTLDRETFKFYISYYLNSNIRAGEYPNISQREFSSPGPASDIHSFDGVLLLLMYNLGNIISRKIPHSILSDTSISIPAGETSLVTLVSGVNDVKYVRCIDPWTRIYVVGKVNSPNIDNFRGVIFSRFVKDLSPSSGIPRQVEAREYQSAIDEFYNVYSVFRANGREAWMTKLDDDGLPVREQLLDDYGISPSITYQENFLYVAHVRDIKGFVSFVGLYVGKYDSFEFIKIWERGFVLEDVNSDSFYPRIQADQREGVVKICLVDSTGMIVVQTLTTDGDSVGLRRLSNAFPGTDFTQLAFHYFSGIEYFSYPNVNNLVNVVGDVKSEITLADAPRNIIIRVDEDGIQYLAYNVASELYLRRVGSWERPIRAADSASNSIDFYFGRVLGLYITRGFPLVFSIRDHYVAGVSSLEITHQVQSVIYNPEGEVIRFFNIPITAFSPDVFERIITGSPYIQFNPEDPENVWIVLPDPMKFTFNDQLVYEKYEIMVLKLFKRGDPAEAVLEKVLRNCHLGGNGDTKTFTISIADEGPRDCCLSRYIGNGHVTRKVSLGTGSIFSALHYLPRPDDSREEFMETLGRGINYANLFSRADRREAVAKTSYAIEEVLRLRFDILDEVRDKTRDVLGNQTAVVTYGTSYFLSGLFTGTTQQIRVKVAEIAVLLDGVYEINLPKVGIEFVYQFVIEIMKRINITSFPEPGSLKGLRERPSQFITDETDPVGLKFREDEAAVMLSLVTRSLNLHWGTNLIPSISLSIFEIFVELSSHRMISSTVAPVGVDLGASLLSQVDGWVSGYVNGVVTVGDVYFRPNDKLFLGGGVGQQVTVSSVSPTGFVVTPSKTFTGTVPINNDADRADIKDAVLEFLTKVYSRPIPCTILRRETFTTKINCLSGTEEIMDYYIGNSELYTVVSKKLIAFNVFMSVEVRRHNPVTLQVEWERRINFSDDKEEFFKPRVTSSEDQVFVSYARENGRIFLETFSRAGSRSGRVATSLDFNDSTKAIEAQVSERRIFSSGTSNIGSQRISVDRRLILSIPRLDQSTESQVKEIVARGFANSPETYMAKTTTSINLTTLLVNSNLTISTETGLPYEAGDIMVIVSQENPNNFVQLGVSSYSTTSLTGNVLFKSGSGVFVDGNLTTPYKETIGLELRRVELTFDPNLNIETNISQTLFSRGFRNTVLQAEELGGIYSTTLDAVSTYGSSDPRFIIARGEYITYVSAGKIKLLRFSVWDKETGWTGGKPDDLDLHNDIPVVFSLRNGGSKLESRKFDYRDGTELEINTNSLISTTLGSIYPDVVSDSPVPSPDQSALICRLPWRNTVVATYRDTTLTGFDGPDLRLFVLSADQTEFDFTFQDSPLTHNQITSNEDGFQYFVYVNEFKELILLQKNEIGLSEEVVVDNFARSPRVCMLPGDLEIGVSYLIYSRGFTDTVEIKFKKYSQDLDLLDESSVLLLDSFRNEYTPTPFVDTGLFVRFDGTLRDLTMNVLRQDALFNGETTGIAGRYIYSVGTVEIGLLNETKQLISTETLGDGTPGDEISGYRVANSAINTFITYNIGTVYYMKSIGSNSWEITTGVKTDKLVVVGDFPAIISIDFNSNSKRFLSRRYRFEDGVQIETAELLYTGVLNATSILETWSPYESAVVLTIDPSGNLNGVTNKILYEFVPTLVEPAIDIPRSDVTISQYQDKDIRVDNNGVQKNLANIESVAKLRLINDQDMFVFDTLSVMLNIIIGSLTFTASGLVQGDSLYIESKNIIGVFTVTSVSGTLVTIQDDRIDTTISVLGLVTKFNHRIEPEAFEIAPLLIRRTRFGFRPVITRSGGRVFMTFMRDVTAFFRVVSMVTVRVNLSTMKADKLLVRAFGELSSDTFFPQTCVRGTDLVRFIIRQDNKLYYDNLDLDEMASIHIWRDGTVIVPVISRPEIRIREYNDKIQVFVPVSGDIYKTTSTTTLDLSTINLEDTVTVTTVDSGLSYLPGNSLVIVSQDVPTDYIDIIVSSYSGVTLQGIVKFKLGNGIHSSWNVNLKPCIRILEYGTGNLPTSNVLTSPETNPIKTIIPNGPYLAYIASGVSQDIKLIRIKNDLTLETFDKIEGVIPKPQTWKAQVSQNEKLANLFIFDDYPIVVTGVNGTTIKYHKFYDQSKLTFGYIIGNQDLEELTPLPATKISLRETAIDEYSPVTGQLHVSGDEPWENINLFYSSTTFTDYTQRTKAKEFDKATPPFEELEVDGVLRRGGQQVREHQMVSDETINSWYVDHTNPGGMRLINFRVRDRLEAVTSENPVQNQDPNGFWPAISLHQNGYVVAYTRSIKTFTESQEVVIRAYTKNNDIIWEEVEKMPDIVSTISSRNKTDIVYPVVNSLQQADFTTFKPRVRVVGDVVCVVYVRFNRMITVSVRRFEDGSLVNRLVNQEFRPISPDELVLAGVRDLFVGEIEESDININIIKYRVNALTAGFSDKYIDDDQQLINPADPTSEQASVKSFLRMSQSTNGQLNVSYQAVIDPDKFNGDVSVIGTAVTVSFDNAASFGESYPGSSYSRVGDIVTITVPGHGFSEGQTVSTISSTGGLGNKSYSIQSIISDNQFTVEDSSSGTITGTTTLLRSGFVWLEFVNTNTGRTALKGRLYKIDSISPDQRVYTFTLSSQNASTISGPGITAIAKDDRTDSRGDRGSGIHQARLFAISTGIDLRKIWSRRNIIRGQEVGVDLPVRPDPTTLVEPLEPIFPSSLISEGSFIMLTKVFAEEIEDLPAEPGRSVIALYNTVYSVARNGLQPRTDHYIEVVRGPEKFQIRFTSLPYVLVNRFEGWLLNVYLDWESKPQFYFINYAVGAVRVSFDSLGQAIAPPGETGYNYWWRPLLNISPGAAELRGVTSTTGFNQGLSIGLTERWYSNGLVAETFDKRRIIDKVNVDKLVDGITGSFTRNRIGIITVTTTGTFAVGDSVYIRFNNQLEESREFQVSKLITGQGFEVQDPVRTTVIGGDVVIFKLLSNNSVNLRREPTGIMSITTSLSVVKGDSVYIRGAVGGEFIVTRAIGNSSFEVMDGRVINWNNHGQWSLDHNPRTDPFGRRTFQAPSIPDNLIILPDRTAVVQTDGEFNLQGERDGMFREYYARKEFFYRANRTRVEEVEKLGYVVNEFLMYLSTIDDSFFRMRNFRGEEGLVSTSDLDLPVSVTPMLKESIYENDLRKGIENEYHITIRPPPPLRPSAWSTSSADSRLVTGLQSVVVNRQGTGIATTLDFNYLVKETGVIDAEDWSFIAPSGGDYAIRRPGGIFTQERSNIRVLLNQTPVNLNLVRNFYPNYITLPGVVSGTNNVRIEEVTELNYLWGSDSVWNGVTFGEGRYVAVGDGAVMYSNDSINWVRGTPSSTLNAWRDVIYADGKFVAVAPVGVNDRIMTSPDGITWTGRPIPRSNAWTSVAFGNNLYVVVGASGDGSRVMTSPDGIIWSVGSGIPNNLWASVTFGNNLFVAVSSTGEIMRSSNGVIWTLFPTTFANSWSAITFGNGLFVVVSSTGPNGGRVITSPDGISWTPRAAPAANWTSVTFGNGIFMAVARNIYMTSSDGITWTLNSIGIPNDWSGVTFGTDGFVAVSQTGSGNRVATSTNNGISWTRRISAARTQPQNGTVVWNGTDKLLISYFDIPLLNRFSTWSQISVGDAVILSDPNDASKRVRLNVVSREVGSAFLDLGVTIEGSIEPYSSDIDFGLGVRVTFVRGGVGRDETLKVVSESVLLNPDVGARMNITFDTPFKGEYRILTNFLKSSISGVTRAFLNNTPKQIQSGSDTLDLFRSNIRSLSQFIPRYIELGELERQVGNTWDLEVTGKNLESFGRIIGVSLWSILYRLNPNGFRGTPKTVSTWDTHQGREVRLGLVRGFVDVAPVFYQRKLPSTEYLEFISVREPPKGVITTLVTTNIITGSGTKFLSQLVVGDIIGDSFGTVVGTVSSITNDTSLVLAANSTIPMSNRSFRLLSPPSFRMRGPGSLISIVNVSDLRVDERFVGYYVGNPKVLHEFIFQEVSDKIIMRNKVTGSIVDVDISVIDFPIQTKRNFFESGLLKGDDERSEDTFFRSGLAKSTTDVLQYRASNLSFFRTDKYEPTVPEAFFKFTEKYDKDIVNNKTVYRLDEERKRVGLFEEFNESGTNVTEGYYVDGLKSGAWVFKYSSGNTHESGSYIRGLRTGLWKVYYDKTPLTLWEEITYTDGVYNGAYKLYYISGNLKEEGAYKKIDFGLSSRGVRDGIWTTYFDKFPRITESTTSYLDGLKNGEYKLYYVSERIREEGQYTNDLKTGEWKSYHDNDLRTVLSIRNYSNDLLAGAFQEYYPPEPQITATYSQTVNDITITTTSPHNLKEGMFVYLVGVLDQRFVVNGITSTTISVESQTSASASSVLCNLVITRLKKKGTYTTNLKSEVWKTFFNVSSSDNIQLEENYSNGLLSGSYQSFLRPGVKKEEGAYAVIDVGYANQSLKSGIWMIYSEGVLSSRGEFERSLKKGPWSYYARGSEENVSKIEVYGDNGAGLQCSLQISSTKVTLNVITPITTSFGDVKTGLTGALTFEAFINKAPVILNKDIGTIVVQLVEVVGGATYTATLTE